MADKLTAYGNYVKSHKDLFTSKTNQDFFESASGTVENFINNRAIYDELNHYKQHGSVLGKHPLFAKASIFDGIRKMTMQQLMEKKENLRINLIRNRKNLRDQPGHVNTADRIQRINEQEAQLKEVKKLLNWNEK